MQSCPMLEMIQQKVIQKEKEIKKGKMQPAIHIKDQNATWFRAGYHVRAPSHFQIWTMYQLRGKSKAKK